MLTNLNIRNYALIRKLNIGFGPGMNTITGETGAGKSIMLGALGLILGKRADTAALLDSQTKCVVEGSFDISTYNLKALFDEHELDYEPETIIRREISPTGKSRAFINDTPVKLNVLKQFGIRFVDIHSQHQTIQLTDPAFRMMLTDTYSNIQEKSHSYSQKFNAWKQQCKKLESLKSQAEQAVRDQDYYRFQWEELSKLDLDSSTFQQIEEEFSLLDNAGNIKYSLEQCIHTLDEEEAPVNNKMREVLKELESMAMHHKTLSDLLERFKACQIEIEDITGELRNFNDSTQVDEERQEELREQIDRINNLLKKHRVQDIEELKNFRDQLEEKLNSFENLDSEIRALESETQNTATELAKLADFLHQERKKSLPALNDKIAKLLKQLGIPDARVDLRIEKQDALTSSGWDKLDFYFSANKGTALQPVQQAASGGELSRIMLSLKHLLADKLFLPTIVFDEIDAGISGEAAIKVGEMIKSLGGSHQVICITHQPQIAALGKSHFTVYKINRNNQTETGIAPLDDEERIQELAKMIGGNRPGEGALQNARELMKKD